MADGSTRDSRTGYGDYAKPHEDLREWMERCEGLGELMRVDGVDWNLEMGSVAEMIYHAKPDNPPAILFENKVQTENLHKLFPIVVRFPSLMKITPWITVTHAPNSAK